MNLNTNTYGVKKRLSGYILLILTTSFLFYSCENLPTDSFQPTDPGQNEDVTNPVADSSASDNTGGGSDNTNENNNETDTPPAAESEFIVFDGMNSHQRPEADIAAAGLVPVELIYSTRMFDGRNAGDLKRENSKELPDQQVIEELAHKAARINENFGVIDIEHWILNPEKGVSQSEIQANMERLMTVLEWYQQSEPDMNWGYYGEVPIRNYWAANQSSSSERFKNWQEANTALKPLAEKVDVLMPSLYTFYRDREGWVRYAETHIAEARRLNPDAKVYVFLWPEYHMSGNVGLQPIEPEFWRLQLETAYKHADGVIIWTRGAYSFDESAGWWQATKDFMQDIK